MNGNSLVNVVMFYIYVFAMCLQLAEEGNSCRQ